MLIPFDFFGVVSDVATEPEVVVSSTFSS